MLFAPYICNRTIALQTKKYSSQFMCPKLANVYFQDCALSHRILDNHESRRDFILASTSTIPISHLAVLS